MFAGDSSSAPALGFVPCPDTESLVLNALLDFVDYCRVERRLADLTCEAYKRDVRVCLTFLSEHGVLSLKAIRTPDLRRFLVAAAEHRPAPASQARTVAALRCFFRFCVQSE